MPPADHCQQRGSQASATPIALGAPKWITPELIGLTLKVWQPYYAAPLSSDDAVIMIQNAGHLCGILRRE